MIDRQFLIRVALGASLLLGCGPSEDDGPPNEIPPPYDDGTLIVERGWLRGDMGDVRSYSGPAVVSASYDGFSAGDASFRLDSLSETSWVALFVRILGVDIVEAPQGTYRNVDGASPITIFLSGQSGPMYARPTYEGRATDGAVTLADDGEGSRTVTIRAVFTEYSTQAEQLVEGSVTYRAGVPLPPPPPIRDLIATDAMQDGTMGSIRAYSGAAAVSEEFYSETRSSFRLDSVGDGWWVMSFVSIQDLDLATATAGTYHSPTPDSAEGEPDIWMLGCSGPSRGDFTFDMRARSIDLTLSDNDDGTRNADVAAYYDGPDGTPELAHAIFRYRVTDPSY